MPQLQPLCSAALVPMYYPGGMKVRISPVQWSKPHSILAPTLDSNPGGRIQNHKRWPLHYHCTLYTIYTTAHSIPSHIIQIDEYKTHRLTRCKLLSIHSTVLTGSVVCSLEMNKNGMNWAIEQGHPGRCVTCVEPQSLSVDCSWICLLFLLLFIGSLFFGVINQRMYCKNEK